MSQNPADNPDVQTIPVNAENKEVAVEQNDSKESKSEPELEEVVSEIEEDNQTQEETQDDDADQSEHTDSSEESSDEEESTENKSSGTDWKDAYIRLAADFDNYRKRTSKEQDDIRRRERERVVKIWLEVYDNAERALESMTEKSGPWYEGFSSLIQQMDKTLAQLNIKVVNDIGEKFDPKRHEAISIVQDPTKENNTIVYVMQKGFVYDNGDVARVAKVVVVRNPS